jgi:hypothetical protein
MSVNNGGFIACCVAPQAGYTPRTIDWKLIEGIAGVIRVAN